MAAPVHRHFARYLLLLASLFSTSLLSAEPEKYGHIVHAAITPERAELDISFSQEDHSAIFHLSLPATVVPAQADERAQLLENLKTAAQQGTLVKVAGQDCKVNIVSFPKSNTDSVSGYWVNHCRNYQKQAMDVQLFQYVEGLKQVNVWAVSSDRALKKRLSPEQTELMIQP